MTDCAIIIPAYNEETYLAATVPPPTRPIRETGAGGRKRETPCHLSVDGDTGKIAAQARNGGTWSTMKITSAAVGQTSFPRADALAVTALDRFGNASAPKELGLQ